MEEKLLKKWRYELKGCRNCYRNCYIYGGCDRGVPHAFHSVSPSTTSLWGTEETVNHCTVTTRKK